MAAKPANAKGGLRASTRQRSRAPASGAKAPVRKSPQLAPKAMRALLEAAHRRGELRNDALVRLPQLVVAPCMMAIVWSGLFDRFAPLDVAALMRAHLDLIFDTGGAS